LYLLNARNLQATFNLIVSNLMYRNPLVKKGDYGFYINDIRSADPFVATGNGFPF